MIGGFYLSKALYSIYKTVSKKVKPDAKLVPYSGNSTLFQKLEVELNSLNIDPIDFFTFTLNYMVNIYSNTLFSHDGNQFRNITRYLANIRSGNELSEEQTQKLKDRYTSLYMLTCLLYNTLRLRQEELDFNSTSNSIYELMLEYSPIIIAYMIQKRLIKFAYMSKKDEMCYDIIKQGGFDTYFDYYEALLTMSDEELQAKYIETYTALNNTAEQVSSIDNNIGLMGTIGSGILKED